MSKKRGKITLSEYEAEKQKLISRDGIWKDEYKKHLIRTGFSQQHSLIVSGGKDNVKNKLKCFI